MWHLEYHIIKSDIPPLLPVRQSNFRSKIVAGHLVWFKVMLIGLLKQTWTFLYIF